MFYGDLEDRAASTDGHWVPSIDGKRAKAVRLLQDMRSSGYHPLSRVPVFDDEELDGLVRDCRCDDADAAETTKPEGGSDDSEVQGPNETDLEYLIRTCKYVLLQ